MKRVFVAAVVCAAFLLLAAAAVAAPRQAASGASLTPHASGLTHGRPAPPAFVPLARRLGAGSGTISLNVYSWDSQPEVGATASWWVYNDDGSYETGEGITGAGGHVDLTGVPAANSENGELTVDIASGDDGWYDLWNMSWGDSGWTGGLQAGNLPVTLGRSSDDGWNAWTAARVWLYAHKSVGNEAHLAASNIARSGTYADGYARTIQTGPETLYGGAAYFWDNEGLELDVDGIEVRPGQNATAAPTAYEADAQRLWADGWASGKPGSAAKVVMNNYPNGWVDQISGVADYPANARTKSFGAYTHNGAGINKRSITIPSTAAPGYAYWIEVTHSDGPLDLWTWYQVCTLKPSRGTVPRGTAIALSGVVPTQGHYGGTRGKTKYVTIYKTTSATVAKTQPKVVGGNRTAGKWVRVGRDRTDGLGKYRLSTRPGRTTWYCAWYQGDDWYWGSWTSVAKVTAR